jgi:hypothetical protein
VTAALRSAPPSPPLSAGRARAVLVLVADGFVLVAFAPPAGAFTAFAVLGLAAVFCSAAGLALAVAVPLVAPGFAAFAFVAAGVAASFDAALASVGFVAGLRVVVLVATLSSSSRRP